MAESSLEVVDRILTRLVVESMMEFLNLPLAKDPSGTSCEEECRWIRVLMERSSICEKYSTHGWSEENFCIFEQEKRLLSVMSQRTLDLSINHCCHVLSTMLCIPEDHFAVDTLRIEQKGTLASWEIPRLGGMIEFSSNLRNLDLHFQFGDGTRYLFESLANLVELSELSLADEQRKRLQRHDLADLLVGAKGRHGPLMRLLQNPQCQLKNYVCATWA